MWARIQDSCVFCHQPAVDLLRPVLGENVSRQTNIAQRHQDSDSWQKTVWDGGNFGG